MCLLGTTLVVQWLRICLAMQGTQVRSLVEELRSTCHRATKPTLHNHRACGLQLEISYPHTLRESTSRFCWGGQQKTGQTLQRRLGDFTVVPWLRLRASNRRGTGLTPGWELRSHSSAAKKIKIKKDTGTPQGSGRKIF